MLRTFDEHVVRPVVPLDGLWDFVTADERSDRAKLPKHYTRRLHVPSCWETIPGLDAYRGQAWLRRHFVSEPDTVTRLVFGGVSHTADVFIDGQPVGHHYDAFTPFAVEAVLKPGAHELVVQVDNTFGDHSALHKENDYYTYGGITRPAELHHAPLTFIERLDAVPRRERGRWVLDVTVRIANRGRQSAKRQIDVAVAGETWDLGALTVRPGRSVAVEGVVGPLDVEPWSAEAPNLYHVEAKLLDEAGGVVDDQIDRIGFREVAVNGKRILLNGEPLHLLGYNRHEDHGSFGCAIPIEQMVSDLQIIADLGGNFVRTCHYPNDLRFLDLCDELGFYVWEESHARQVDFKHPKFREQIAASTEEMVAWHRNRPSIILWGCLNECDSVSKAGRREHERVLKQLKALDPTRPVTFASNKPYRDLCLDLVDVVSWNSYVGWYGGAIEKVEQSLSDYLAWLHSSKSGGGRGKPLIMSEFGGGAIPGYRAPHRAHWTEEYQQDVLDEELRVYANHPDVAGVAIWQFCDVRITKGWWQRRPRTMNNKGTVDEYRRPKLAYATVKQRLEEARQRRS